MIISRTPVRLPLGGGGTDLASYYSKFGGFFISAAIDKYNYIAIQKRFENGFRISYSKTEITDKVENIQQPIIREALKLLDVNDYLEIVSIADVPGRSGLGGSSSYAVGVLNALHSFKRDNVSRQALAEEACQIEIGALKEPIGKQDQYVASFGGINCYEIERDGTVHVNPLVISQHSVAELEGNLLLFYTRINRDASQILRRQKQDEEKGVKRVVEAMHEIKEIGYQVRDSLANGDIRSFGELLDVHWRVKKNLSEQVSNNRIDQLYEVAKRNGALGGKVCFPGSTFIKTKNGTKPIREITIDDMVYDHKHSLQHVSSVLKRHYKGKILEITVKGLENKIQVTPEHPLMTTVKHPLNKRVGRNIVNLPVFKEAKEFKKGDVLLVPVNEEEVDLEYLDMPRDVKQPKYSNCDIYKDIPQKVPVDFNLLNVLGWYIAEGSANRKQFQFVSNIKEKPYAEQIVNNIMALFSKTVSMKTKGNSIFLTGGSVVISNWLRELCGHGAENKQIPAFVMQLPRQKQATLVRALWLGDGALHKKYDHRTKKRYIVCEYKTVSYKLAKQVQELCFRLGFIPSLRKSVSPPLLIYQNEKTTSPRPLYRVSIHGEDARTFQEFIKKGMPTKVVRQNAKQLSLRKDFITINGHTYAKRSIINITQRDFDGVVFNLAVQGSHTFIAEDVAVHNCGAGGGGFFVFYSENGKERLRNAMAKEGLKEVRFRFDFDGSKILLNL